MQRFIGSHWGEVTPFALPRAALSAPGVYHDPGAPPYLGGDRSSEYCDAFAQVVHFSAALDPDDGALIDIGPGALGSELRWSWIGGADFGGEASRGSRRRGIDGANFDGEVRQIGRQIDSGCGQTRGLATRSGLLQLRRPAFRETLRFTILPGAGPHRSGRPWRRCGAGEPPPSLRGSPPLPARSTAAVRTARLGDVSAMAAPERLSARTHPMVAYQPRAVAPAGADHDLDQSAALLAVRGAAPASSWPGRSCGLSS